MDIFKLLKTNKQLKDELAKATKEMYRQEVTISRIKEITKDQVERIVQLNIENKELKKELEETTPTMTIKFDEEQFKLMKAKFVKGSKL